MQISKIKSFLVSNAKSHVGGALDSSKSSHVNQCHWKHKKEKKRIQNKPKQREAEKPQQSPWKEEREEGEKEERRRNRSRRRR